MKSVPWFAVVFCCCVSVQEVVAASHARASRVKRQSNAGDALVDAVFQIPIQTLNSVGTLVKATRPVIMQVRQRIQQNLAFQPQRFSFPGRPQASAYQRPQPQASTYQRPQASAYQRPSRASDKVSLSQHQRPHRFSASTYHQYFGTTRV